MYHKDTLSLMAEPAYRTNRTEVNVSVTMILTLDSDKLISCTFT